MADEYIGTKQQKLQLSEGTVILDFYATWCGPCKKLSPLFTKLCEEAKQKGTQTSFFKVDVDIHEDLTEKYAIDAMPTVLVLVNGKQQERVEGYDPASIEQLFASRT